MSLDLTRKPSTPPAFPFLTGFEGTHIYGTGTDVLETTKHTEWYQGDLVQLTFDGVSKFRACIPWHKIEQEPGVFDWTWPDKYLRFIRKLGLTPIVDPLHHTSTPVWLTGGFSSPFFPQRYRAFVKAFAQRYPWVKEYTVINEPFATGWLAGHEGIWHPNLYGHEGYVPIALNMAKAICMVTEMLIEQVPGVQFLHTDSCEYHQALDKESEYHARKSNEMRFSILDLILGKFDSDHYLYTIFREHGMSERDVVWFKEHAARIDTLGLDYYAVHEAGWTVKGRTENITPLGLKAVALQYVDRYSLPVMMSEVNIRGYVEDRITWLKYTVQESELLAEELAARGIPFRGYCWYPYIDSTDWSSMVREANGHIDPQGIYWLSEGTLDRNPSELSELYSGLAHGTLRAKDLPAYEFHSGALDTCQVRKFLPLMKGWDWKTVPGREDLAA